MNKYGFKKESYLNNVIAEGLIKVYEDLHISFFDEDEGFINIKIEEGTYLFRMLNLRGWIVNQVFDERPDFGWVDLDMHQKDSFDILTF